MQYSSALRVFLEDEGYTNIDIKEESRNRFEVTTDEEDMEFFVGNYNESYDVAKEDILNLLDDMGIESLSPDYPWRNFVDDSYFEEAYDEMERSYLEDIRLENDSEDKYANRLIQELVEDWNIIPESALVENEDGLLDLANEDDYDDYIEKGVEALKKDIYDYYGGYAKAYLEELGKDNFDAFIEYYPDAIDYDAMAEDIINTDGFGPSIATYDGEENEVSVRGTTYYIYRTN